jgi:hypothetical protein
MTMGEPVYGSQTQGRASALEFVVGPLANKLLGREDFHQEGQNVTNSNPHATNAGVSSALLGIHHYTIHQCAHRLPIPTCVSMYLSNG